MLPAVRVNIIDDALKALDALRAAELPVCEIAMSSVHSSAILHAAVERHGGYMIVGAGTVLNAETAAKCEQAGAKFIVTPTFSRGVINYCRRHSIPIISGAFTPTEILASWEAGANCVKVFPASCAGGPTFIRAIRAPFPHIDLLPMGGVSVSTASGYIRAGASALGVGNDLIDAARISQQDVSEIIGRVNDYRAQVNEARSEMHQSAHS